MNAGRLFGLGLGPGDPELVTLKAVRLLRGAAVVAYPAPKGGASFARGIVAAWLRPEQREIAIDFPMRPGPPPDDIYDGAAAAIAAELDQGSDVAVLCQGDPFFYGSFALIFTRLAPRYRVEVVPGVSSLTACAAAAAAPLVARDDTVTVIPATLTQAELRRRLGGCEAAAILKLGRHAGKVRAVLDELGLLERTIYVERASLERERVARFADIDPAAVPYFAMALLPADRR
ncbi:MAG: precorrin-2 C(20)-methyltransferase [Alphaproteobacteria bacterium]|nr:precorrin-2 C(20)-methyltransferase [Alphaproteobacteria bacterium]